MTEIVVTAPARLHFGMLDPAGIGTRRFGGCGVGVESPRVSWRSAPAVRARTSSRTDRRPTAPPRSLAGRAPRSVTGAAIEVDVREAIPPHVGLGSGTKLGLAIARAVAELAGIRATPGGARRRERAGRALERWLAGRSPRQASWSRPAWPREAGSARSWLGHLDARAVAVRARRARGRRGTLRGRRDALLRSAARAGGRRATGVATAADRPAPGTADGRHRRVRRRAHRDPARDRIDVRRPAGWRISSACGSGRRGAARDGGRSGGTELVGAVGVRDRRAAPSVPPRWPIGCAPPWMASADVRVVDFDRRGAWVARDGSRTGGGMRLLVSVVSAEEARRALAGGADIIDVKDPNEGALGAPSPACCPTSCGRSSARPPRSASRSATCRGSRTPRRWPRAAPRSAAPAMSRSGCGRCASSTPRWR